MQIRSGWDVNIGRKVDFCVTLYGSQGGIKIRNINGWLDRYQIQYFKKSNVNYRVDVVSPHDKSTIHFWIDRLISGNVRYDPEMEQYMLIKKIVDDIYNNSII